MRKRVLSLLLAICLVIGLLPPTTLATSDGASGSGGSTDGASGNGGSTGNASPELITVTIAGLAAPWTADPTDEVEDVYYAKVESNAATDITAEVKANGESNVDWHIKLDNRDTVAKLTLKGVNLDITTTGISADGAGELEISVEGAASTVTSNGGYPIKLNMGMGTTITSVNNTQLNLNIKTGAGASLYSKGAGGVVLKNANLVAYNKSRLVTPGGSINVEKGDLKVEGGTLQVTAEGYSGYGIRVDAGKLVVSDNANVAVNKKSATSSASQNLDTESYAVKTQGGIEIGGGYLEIKNAAGNTLYTPTGKTKSLQHGTISGEVRHIISDADKAKGDKVVATYTENATTVDETTTTSQEIPAANILEAYKYISFRYVCGEGNHDYGDDRYNPTCIKCGDSTRPVPKDITVTVGSITWNAIAGDVFYAKVESNAVEDITAKIASGELTDADWNIKLDNRDLVAKLTLKGVNLDIDTTGIKASGAGALEISVEGSNSTLTTSSGHPLYLDMGGDTTISSVNNTLLTLNIKTTGQFYSLYSKGAGGVVLKNANLIANSGTNAGYAGGSIKVELGDLKVEGGTLTVLTDFNKNVTNALGVLVNAGKLIVSDGAKVTVNKTSKGASSKLKSDLNSYAVEAAGGIEIAGGSLTVTNTAGSTDVAGGSYSVHHGTISGAVSYNIVAANLAAGDKVVATYTEAATTVNDTTATSEAIPAANILEGYKYISFQYVCGADNHDFGDDPSNPTCLKCGYTDPTRPKDITVHVITDGGEKQTAPLTDVYDKNVTVPAGKTYYGITNGDGLVTSFQEYAPGTEPTEWTFKVINASSEAQLIFNNAKLTMAGEYGNLLTVTGDGALKIVALGESTFTSGGKNNVIKTEMVGGTTYTSENGGKLTLKQNNTSGASAIRESAGVLNFVNANIYASSMRNLKKSASPIITGSFDVNVSGGCIEIESLRCSTYGLSAGGILKLTDLAKVRLIGSTSSNNYENSATDPRYAVQATGDIIIEEASLRIIDAIGNWDAAVNKMPKLEKVKAEYSANADASDPQPLNPADPAAPIEYPYVAFIYDCIGVHGDHAYDPSNPDADPDCDRCGEVRDVPRDVTVTFAYQTETKGTLHYFTVTVPAGQVYYAKTDDQGVFTTIGLQKATDAAPSEWNIKLDNNKPITNSTAAELTLNKAYLKKAGNEGEATKYSTIAVVGEGALQITVAGDSKLESGHNNTLSTAMTGGTTYTSVNGSKLTLIQNGTSGAAAIRESVGVLNFVNANIYASSKCSLKNTANAIVRGGFDVNVSGGCIEIESVNCSTNGLTAGGDLTLTNWAQVRLIGQKQADNRYEASATNPRHAVKVTGNIIIEEASLRIIDAIGNWDAAVNKMPTLKKVKAEYSANADASDPQPLNPADPAAPIEYPYVAFIYDCIGVNGKHTYDASNPDGDPDCDLCGYVRSVPRPVTLTITNIVKKVLEDGKQIVWNAQANEVYYASTDANGVVTDLGTTDPGDGNWNIKLDNRKATAELTFRNATVKMQAQTGLASANSAIKVEGDGALQIIIDGNCNFESGLNNTLSTAMKGGTTYTSDENGGKLTLIQDGTSGSAAIRESAGVLNFVNANIYASSNCKLKNTANAIVRGSFDVNVSGGYIEIESVNCSTNGLTAGGNLNLTNWANVRLIGQKQADNRYVGTAPRCAVKATGDITIKEASLRITDAIGNWDAAVNKSPKLFGSSAKYSESAEGTNLQPLDPADPAAPVEYPYVEYVVDCAEHIWDGPADPNCNRCGFVRAVPYDIQVAFQFGTSALGIVAWNAKVGEVYYAKTNDAGVVTDLGKQDSEPKDWNIKLDNSVGNEAILTFKGATIIRKVAPTSNDKVFDLTASAFGGTVGARGKGSLRIVCEKASTITTDASSSSIVTSMNGGTTYESKDNAKLTFTTSKTSLSVGLKETVGNLTFDHANLYVRMHKTAKKNPTTTVSAPRNMTVIGGKVEIVASAYASNGLNVKGNLLVKENGILLVTTSSKAKGGTCENRPHAINVTGDITVDNATLMIKSYSAYWKYLVNKMPTLVGADSYMSEKSTKESKLEAFSKDAGADLTELVAKFLYFSNAKPGTLDDSAMDEEEEEEDDSLIFDDLDNPFTGDTVNLTLLFVLVMTSAAALVVLFSKKKIFRE